MAHALNHLIISKFTQTFILCKMLIGHIAFSAGHNIVSVMIQINSSVCTSLGRHTSESSSTACLLMSWHLPYCNCVFLLPGVNMAQ